MRLTVATGGGQVPPGTGGRLVPVPDCVSRRRPSCATWPFGQVVPSSGDLSPYPATGLRPNVIVSTCLSVA